jgi:arylsulfatase A-like enzyme
MAPYAALKENRKTLGGMLAAVDAAAGQIVAALEEAGLRESTLIIFSSDNGGPNPGSLSTNGNLRAGKGTLYEGGVRVCAFANWPGHIEAGQRIKEPMHAVDWFPTLVTLAGGSLEQPLPLDGKDVWPMLTQGAKSPHTAILLVGSLPTRAALRMGDWKLLRNASDQDLETLDESRQPGAAKSTPQLYNLATDIGETTDLAAKEPERVATMQALLDAYLTDAVKPGSEGLPAYKPAAKGKGKAKRE